MTLQLRQAWYACFKHLYAKPAGSDLSDQEPVLCSPWLSLHKARHNFDQTNDVQVSIAMVITTEQAASYIAGKDPQLGYKVADAFLLYMITEADGALMDRLQDTSWLATAIFTTAEQMPDIPPPDEASVSAVADAIVLANQQLVERRRAFDGDIKSLTIDWAKIAHSADVMFAESAAELREGDLTTETYRCGAHPDQR